MKINKKMYDFLSGLGTLIKNNPTISFPRFEMKVEEKENNRAKALLAT